jgi:ubiquinone/menaquinone biosynthesis C-methylase UbiE
MSLVHKKNQIYTYKKNKKKIYFEKLNLKIKKKNFSLIDLGTASGDFLFFLESFRKNQNNLYYGVEKEKYLINLSKQKKKDKIIFIQTDFTKKNFNLDKKFDYVTCLGVINYFDDVRYLFKKMFKLCKKKGHIFIYDIFNDDPINLRLKVNYTLEKNNKWYSQFNCFSEKYIQELCKKINPNSKVLFHKMNFKGINIKKNKYPLLTSYTKKIDKKKVFISPYNQILPFKILEIQNR